MKIKDFTDTIRHLTDPFNIPEARRMIQENPALTQEQFKAGGIVEPGVTHYANPEGRSKIKISDWTSEQKANLKTWMDNTGSTLKDYDKRSAWNKHAIKYGRVTGIKQTGEFGKTREGAATKKFRNWLSKQDPKTLTADSVDDLIKQSKIKRTPGFANAIHRIMKEKEFAKFKNIQLGRTYPTEQLDEFADAVLDAYAKDDITKIAGKKHKSVISRVKANQYGNLDQLIKKTGLDEETIFDLFDDRDAFHDLELSGEVWERGRQVDPDKGKFYKKAENWIVKNSKRYEDPDKFKKAFTRTFGKNNHLIQTINKNAPTSIPFSDWFRKNIMGTTGPSYSSGQLDGIFKTAIYTNNTDVRNKIINAVTDVLPETGSRMGYLEVRKILNENPLLKKFGINRGITGPIARLFAKEVGDDVRKQISLLRKPWLGTKELITYLKDKVDPKYKSMFEETATAISYAQKNQWPEARKALNLSQDIMFDHKVPKALMDLGYADEIEYIKLQPASAEFNSTIKRLQFDMPMVKLTEKWEEAKTPDAKAKVVREMNELKDNFSKKYGGYLDEVKITPDKITDKPMFSSTAEVVTKKTDLPKLLEDSLRQEKGLSPKVKNAIKIAKTAKGPARLKALNAIVATVGTAAAASLFTKFGITPATADTGAVSSGVTGGDIALGSAAPLATKKGRKIYGTALKGAAKVAGTVPGILAIEAGLGPGIVASMGGTFGEAIASPLLLEGTMRDKRIYNKLREVGFGEDDIETVKDSLMLEADPFTSSMMPTSEAATNVEVKKAASEAYDWASEEMAKEDRARLDRANKFDYLQDTGFNKGGRVSYLDGGIVSLLKK